MNKTYISVDEGRCAIIDVRKDGEWEPGWSIGPIYSDGQLEEYEQVDVSLSDLRIRYTGSEPITISCSIAELLIAARRLATEADEYACGEGDRDRLEETLEAVHKLTGPNNSAQPD